MTRTFTKAWLVVIALILVTSIPAAAQDKDVANHPRVKEALELLDIWVEAELGYKRIPGISLAIVLDQDLLWSNGWGYANREEKIPAKPDTIYSICSISKLFTSVSVMQMRDAGKISLEDPLDDHLSWFAIVRSDPDAPPITIRSIMTHSSGLPRESDQPYKGEPDLPWAERESIIELLPNQVTMYPPSKYFMYSNLGISLLGEMVAELSGMSYQDYVLKNVIMPIGMTDTTPYLPEEELGKRLAVGYSRWEREGDRKVMGFFQANGITPAAGLASTAIDLGKFASWQFRALAAGKDDPILSGYTLKEMYRVHWLDPDWNVKWGLGFATWRVDGITFVGHGGGCPGYRTHLLLNPKDKIATVSMVNAGDINPQAFTQQAHNVIKPAIDAALNGGDEPEAEPESEDVDYSLYTGLYHAHWGENAFFIWEGKLASLYLPTSDIVKGITKYKYVGNHTFRRIQDDGELAEATIFELDENGQVFRCSSHNFYSQKVR